MQGADGICDRRRKKEYYKKKKDIDNAYHKLNRRYAAFAYRPAALACRIFVLHELCARALFRFRILQMNVELYLQWIGSHPYWSLFICFLVLLCCIASYDILQKRHIIIHNFPIVGRLRYWLEVIGPELRQYIVANDKEEQPFSRAERRWIYASSKGQNNYFGFGTTEILYEPGYPVIKNAAFPILSAKVKAFSKTDPTCIPCPKILGAAHARAKAYRPGSVINISAMSFGSLGKNAVSALNKGAKLASCYHNCGEGGLSSYHLSGADLALQIGTGYFGMRDERDRFSFSKLEQVVRDYPQIKLIEIKLSQGAKPGKGGVLPASKVDKEIARVRGVPEGQPCISPNGHVEFHDTTSLLNFIEEIALRTGLPVGIKAAIGKEKFWKELAYNMRKRREGPDFIAIDGGEAGTGAAPLTYADHVSLPFKTAFARVYQIFMAQNIAQDIVWIGSGKLGFPDRAIVAFAMGCDMIQIAREAMISIGCIQAQRCHTGGCPTGIATHNKWLQSGLDVEKKARRFAKYIQIFRRELLELSHTAGYEHPCQFTGEDIEISMGLSRYKSLKEILGYSPPKEPYPYAVPMQESA